MLWSERRELNRSNISPMFSWSSELKLSLSEAGAVQLAAQGLIKSPKKRATKADVLREIRRMGGLQIDTISVVARSQHLVLWSRLGEYNEEWLDELHAEGALFEYYSHAACYLPTEDFRLYRHKMLEAKNRDGRGKDLSAADQESLNKLHEHIRHAGAVRSSDFDRVGAAGAGWWDWKPEKLALERLHLAGIVMISKREGFQRLYDLRERVLPDWDDALALPAADARRELIIKAVRALGIASPKWVSWYFYNSLKRYHSIRAIPPVLSQLVDEGTLIEIKVDGLPFYIHRENIEWAERAAAGRLKPTLTTLLSPFDPLVRDRDRALELFGFHYRIEVYVPEEKRKHGYFSLPILHRGRIIGRLDPKAHRKQGVFEVKSIHLEPGIPITDVMVSDLAQTLKKCAAWHKTPEVVIRLSDPPELAGPISAELANSA